MLKQQKILYWITTAIISAMMLFSAYAYLVDPNLEQAFIHLGFPSYFRIQLAIAKIIGSILLLVPVGNGLKHWTYAGFTFTFVSASLAHFMVGDALVARVSPMLFLAGLMISYILYYRIQFNHQKK